MKTIGTGVACDDSQETASSVTLGTATLKRVYQGYTAVIYTPKLENYYRSTSLPGRPFSFQCCSCTDTPITLIPSKLCPNGSAVAKGPSCRLLMWYLWVALLQLCVSSMKPPLRVQRLTVTFVELLVRAHTYMHASAHQWILVWLIVYRCSGSLHQVGACGSTGSSSCRYS